MKSAFALKRTNIALALAATAIGSVAQTPIRVPGLCNTGVDNSREVLPLLSLEQHYTVSGAATNAYVVPPVYDPARSWFWAPAPAGSAWIGPNSTTNTSSPDPVGVYHYVLKFDLTGFDVARVKVSGYWMTDNAATLLLNGKDTGFNKEADGFHQLDSFTITSGFLPGLNSLEFRVENEDIGPNPTGLVVGGLAAELRCESSSGTCVPDRDAGAVPDSTGHTDK
jgi:hypothetical protein